MAKIDTRLSPEEEKVYQEWTSRRGRQTHFPVPSSPGDIDPSFRQFPSWRPEQDTVLQSLLESEKDYLELEAPTGSGKTLVGFSYHKLMNYYGTIYSPTTKQLQDQVMGDFGPFSVALKGRLNYPCLQPGVESAAQCIHSSEEPCEFLDECSYRQKVKEAEGAEVAVLNIWALLCQINYANRFTKRPLLILDEADTLEDSLTGFASRDLTKRYLRANHLDIPDFSKPDISYWKGYLEEQLNSLTTYMARVSTKEDKNKLTVVYNNLSFLYSNLDETWVTQEGEDKITFTPTDISALAHKYLFRHYDRVLLMSASFCGDQIYSEIMGLSRTDYDYFSVPSYFPPHKRPIFFFPIAKMIQKEEEEAFPHMVEIVDGLLGLFFEEQIIIHTVSNSRAEKLQQQSSHSIEIYNSQEGKGNLELFRNGDLRILASPSLERGYDFPDDACRINILIKVPYPYLGSNPVQARMKAHKKWYNWQAVQKIVQMTGRSTRSTDDYSLAFILDSKFLDLWASSKDLFPQWWKDAFRDDLTKVDRSLLEEAQR